MNTADALAEANRLSRLIDAAIEAMKNTTVEYADAERNYRKAKAEAWVRCPRDEAGARDWTAGRREAWVDAETADLRYKRDLADGMRHAAVEANRSRRAQLSALQTFLNAEKAEAEFVRTGMH
jgi:hypothetical protein